MRECEEGCGILGPKIDCYYKRFSKIINSKWLRRLSQAEITEITGGQQQLQAKQNKRRNVRSTRTQDKAERERRGEERRQRDWP